MKIRLKAPAGLTSTGIYGKDGVEMEVGHELTVQDEPRGWAGRYDVVSGGDTDGKTPVLNPDQSAGYAVKDKGGGWFVVVKGDDEVTKSFRKDDLDGFESMSDEDKTAFVELHKKEA